MKEILRQISEFLRSSFLVLLVVVSASLAIYRLVKLQIVAAEEEAHPQVVESVYTQVIPATRGEILDRNGNPLVTNRQGNSVVFESTGFPKTDSERNALIYSLIQLFEHSHEE